MGNSIISGLNPENIEAEFVLVIRSHIAYGKIVIFTEGADDRDIYQKVYGAAWHAFSSTRWPGCNNLMRATIALNKYYSDRFIAIKDADFDHLEGTTYGILNLFLTDTHDIETLMMTKTFCDALASKYSIGLPDTFVYDAARAIIHLSYIKWMNMREKRYITFGHGFCKVGTCYDGRTHVTTAAWLSQLRDNHEKKARHKSMIPTEQEVEDFERCNALPCDALMQLTNGHDLVEAIVKKLNVHTEKNVKKKEVGEFLSESYTAAEHSKTALGRAIEKWMGNRPAPPAKKSAT